MQNYEKNLQDKNRSQASSQRPRNLSRKGSTGRLEDQQGPEGPRQARSGTAQTKKAQTEKEENAETQKAQMDQDQDQESESGGMRFWLK